MRHQLSLALCGSVLVAGCLADQLDPPPSGVFACEADEDCPPDQSCLFDVCQSGTLPSLEIRAPEPREVISVITPGEDAPDEIIVTAFVGGRDLELVSAGETARVGEGLVDVYVDAETTPQLTLTAGSITAGVPAELTVQNTPGAHRIRAVATLADGLRYENPEATATTLVWIDDGLPHVGLENPAPFTVFGVDDVATDVEITTLNFDFVQAKTVIDPGNVGHAHIHYQQQFPACLQDPTCDNGYLGVVAPTSPGASASATVSIVLPASGEGLFTLTSVLRHTNHSLFAGDDGMLPPVFETVTIERNASVSSEPAEDGG